MSCESIQQSILDHDWDRARLEQAAALLAHIETCDSCRLALSEYDDLRAVLKVDPEEIPGNWSGHDIELPASDSATLGQPARSDVRGTYFPAALAASVLVAITGWAFYWSANGTEVVKKGVPAPGMVAGGSDMTPPSQDVTDIRLSIKDIDRHVELFRNLNDVSESRTTWVALSGANTELGMEQAPLAPAKSLVMLRFVVTRDGKEISRSDVVGVPGHSADVSIPFEGQNTLRYKLAISSQETPQLMVVTQIRTSGGPDATVAAMSTSLDVAENGQQSVGELVTDSGRYELSVGYAKQEVSS